MKYIFPVALAAISKPGLLLAHDSSGHVETLWYQELSLATILIGLALMLILLVGAAYYQPRYQRLLASMGIVSILVALVGLQTNQTSISPISESIMTSLTGIPVTVYRTEGCACCSGFAEELQTTGAEVTVETVTLAQMQRIKSSNGITPKQESCHTSIIDGYVVEGHVPFAAIAQLVDDRPSISGITQPGMPIGTPGMPGKQTAVYTVTTLEDELFWQSS